MYIFPKNLVIEFYQELSVPTAVRYEDGAVFQSHTVSVSAMEPWHQNILGELVEWIGPEVFHGDFVDTEHIPSESCQSISIGRCPVDLDDCRNIPPDIL
ncbi:unnamed protein product [Dibothriocephalus latus]|uniref:Uncharacterized protein n=1 Tax=Dibothriocephalus latus TaxID=60516 RepID=A0A3P7NQC9_DIBLA|nr:unnamed protein product [Dibothriocephalus latus]